MDNLDLFTQALMLNSPWRVTEVVFTQDPKPELHLTIDFAVGSKFPCPTQGCEESALEVHDTKERVWRHLNFFQYKAFIHARVPRVTCPTHGVHQVEVPWSRPGSGFTLLIEAYVVELAKHLPVAVIAALMDEHDNRLWRILHHYVNAAREAEVYPDVDRIGIDETSRKGHHYITVVVDLAQKRVLYCTEGKDASTITSFIGDFKRHQGDPDKIRLVTCDMSLGFKKGITEGFVQASMIIDKFHVVKHANEAVDLVRKSEAKSMVELKRTKYIWLKNPGNLTEKQQLTMESLRHRNLKTARAYQMRLNLQSLYETCFSRQDAEVEFHKLTQWMMHSRLEPMKDLARLLRRHAHDILNYFEFRITNAILEGMNSIIQNIKRRARGFRNIEYFKTMIYLVCGKLNLHLASAF